MSILSTKQLTKQYGTEPNIVKALDGVSISIEPGEFVAIIGTSGSGKSTLLNMLGGLDRPTSGSVRVDNYELGKLKDEDLTVFRRQRIGFIFQNYNLVPVLNVYENIVMPIQLDGKKSDQKFIKEIVALLGLEKKLYNMPNTLSGGQQQRVAIARALASKGKFLSGGYVVMEAATGAEDSGKETQPTYSVGDTVELNGQQYEVMAIVADIPTITEGVNSSTQDFLSFYLPADTFRAMYPDNTLRKLFFDVVEEYQPQAEEMLIQYQQDVDKSLNYTAKSTLIEHYQEQTRANTVMGFAISLIIAFVGILNFVNSMVTAIVSRQKEFAMIQSIGMTKRQLRRMLIDEGLYYAGSTLLAAYVLGTVAVAVGVRMMVAGDWTATFHFTLLPLVICTPILIAFAIVIPYICFKNLEKQSIVERLRATD